MRPHRTARDRQTLPRLIFSAAVGDEIEFRARGGLELRWPFLAGKIIADAKCVTARLIVSELVDGGKRLVLVRAFGAGNGHAVRLSGGVERVGSAIGLVADESFILAVFQLESDGFQDGSGH